MLESILKYWFKTSAQQDCTRLNQRGAFIKVEKLPSFSKQIFHVTLKKVSLEMEKTEKCLSYKLCTHSSPISYQLMPLRSRNINFCFEQNPFEKPFLTHQKFSLFFFEAYNPTKGSMLTRYWAKNHPTFSILSIFPIFISCNNEN